MRLEKNPRYEYIEKCYGAETPQMQLSRQYADQLGLGAISISQTEARLMKFLLTLIKPQKMVEIGTLTGLSCQYFLQSLQQDGIIYTLEKSKEHLALASEPLKPWIEKGQCILIEGDAREKLKELKGPFDAVFIDGNKAAYGDYWAWASHNITSGGLVLIDNVFLSGSVWSEVGESINHQKFGDKQIKVMKQMIHDVLNHPDFESAFVPTEEGLLLAFKK
ncbi:MAG: O-methyltransferase [Pseudobdellovibrio sp.]